jgi:hypothetical protein
MLAPTLAASEEGAPGLGVAETFLAFFIGEDCRGEGTLRNLAAKE